MAGFKYFELDGEKTVSVELRGNGSGSIEVSTTPDFAEAASIPVDVRGGRKTFSGRFDGGAGVKALYIKFVGTGAVDFIAFELK